MTANTNLVPVPTLSPMPFVTNAIGVTQTNTDFANIKQWHTNDAWQSADGNNEPLSNAVTIVGAPATYTTNTWLGVKVGTTNYYSTNINVWLPPGSVDYAYSTNNGSGNPVVRVSNFNNPTQNVNVKMYPGDSNVLVVPGYVVDGIFFDGLDLSYSR